MTHKQKKLNEEELREFRTRFGIPISDDDVAQGAVLSSRPTTAPEMKYLRERRKALGGSVPGAIDRAADASRCRSSPTITEFVRRRAATAKCRPRWPSSGCSAKLLQGQEDRQVHRADRARRIAHLRHGRPVPPVRHLLRTPASSTSRSIPIRSLYYREAKDGQILEEGITEAGSMSSFIAAGTAYSHARRQHDPVLHLLLDVRLPADRRPDLGRRRCAGQGLHARRHRRPHDAQRRRPAASGRPQPAERDRPSRPCAPTTRPTPTKRP